MGRLLYFISIDLAAQRVSVHGFLADLTQWACPLFYDSYTKHKEYNAGLHTCLKHSDRFSKD